MAGGRKPATKPPRAVAGNSGRPRGGGAYRAEYADMAEAAAAVMGATDEQLARLFKVSRQTISAWKRDHVEFTEALRRGKEAANDNVEASLYKRAVGFAYTEKKVATGAGGRETTVYTRRAIGDVTAQMKWLTNRRPERWKCAPDAMASDEPVLPVAVHFIECDARVAGDAAG